MVEDYVDFGAGPRAGQAVIMAAKGHALMNGRFSVTPEDIKAVILPSLRHRILLNFKAESEKMTTDSLISHLMEKF